MREVSIIGIDLSKNRFHGAYADGSVAFRRKQSRRGRFCRFCRRSRLARLQACGGAHYWGREIGKLGHEVRLIPRFM